MLNLPHRSTVALSTVLLMLMAALLACTSNDTLFIKLTLTPVPSLTPTPLVLETRFSRNDKVFLVGSQRLIEFAARPGEKDLISAQKSGSCIRNTSVTVLDVSRSVLDQQDTAIYYKLDCGGSGQGWLPEFYVSIFNPRNGSAQIKTKDGKGAPLFEAANAKSATAASKSCPEATKVTVTDLTREIDLSRDVQSVIIYARVNCGSERGYVLESNLAPVQQ